MVLEDVGSDADVGQEVTPMSEIRQHQALLLDEFNRQYPDWEWSERRRRNRLMWDAEGRAWVPMFDPEYGAEYAYDEPGFTPEAEEALVELSRRAVEEVKAGIYYTLDDLDAEDGILGIEDGSVE